MRENKSRGRTRGDMLLLNYSSSSSSTIRRQPPPETFCSSSTTIGCMSGIFRFFSKHHSSRRLTFGRKEESGGSGCRTDSHEVEERSGSVEVDNPKVIISTESPRSPTTASSSAVEVVAEKRMFLLGALAKCDEDLRELKKIIEELKSDNLPADDDDDDYVTESQKAKDELISTELSSSEQPSPVSVLDEVTRSPPFSRCATKTSLQYGNFQQQQQTKKIYKDEFHGSLHLINIQQVFQRGSNLRNSTLWRSRAMVETVEKSSSEIAWGEKREQGRIGMALQEQIYRDLINETVNEVMEIGNMHCMQHLKLAYINAKLQLHRRESASG